MRPLFIVVFLVVLAAAVSSCRMDAQQPVIGSAPEYISRDSLLHSVVLLSAQPLLHPGKTIAIGNFLYINEQYKGWHIVNNSQPNSPHNSAFLNCPGAVDGTTNGQYLYTNNSNDLVIVDASDPAHPKEAFRSQRVLNTLPSTRDPMPYRIENAIIGWHDTTFIRTQTF